MLPFVVLLLLGPRVSLRALVLAPAAVASLPGPKRNTNLVGNRLMPEEVDGWSSQPNHHHSEVGWSAGALRRGGPIGPLHQL